MEEIPVINSKGVSTLDKPIQSRVAWHSIDPKQLEVRLSADFDSGLTDKRVADLQKRYGLNSLGKSDSDSLFRKIIAQLKNPLVAILVAAGLVTIFLGHILDAFVIALALLVNISIGVIQEERSSKAFNKLQESQEKYASVIRAGKRKKVLAQDLVVGDIVIVEAGVNVPADIRLLKSSDLSINEAPLTGEWVSVPKEVCVLKENTSMIEQSNMLWSGTLVASGFGEGIVVEIGKDTQIGNVASLLSLKDVVKTPVQVAIHKLAIFITYVIIFAIILIFILGLLRGETLVNILLVAIAISVSAVPEGLPAALTAVLAIGMEKILKKGGLVRNILTAETLGSTTIIITDKTGTLTAAKMSLEAMVSTDSLRGLCNAEDLLTCNGEMLRMGVLSSDAYVEEGAGEDGGILVHGRPIEKAIVTAGLARGFSESMLSEKYERLDFLSFSSENRFALSLNKNKKQNRFYFSGAPEKILELSSRVLEEGKMVEMTEDIRKSFIRAQKEESAKGRRVTAIAFKNTKDSRIPRDSHGLIKKESSKNLVFVGLLVFGDPIREDVPNAIKEAQSAGARVVMATGDNPETARTIANEAGISTDTSAKVFLGRDIENMSDKELLETLRNNSIFARVLPSQKLRIVNVLRNEGEIVAMTGDGINDAPALKSADIGIVVGSGTDVAKEASDLVLLDNSFSIIVDAIREGRRIIDNLKRIIVHLISTSFGEMFLIIGALAFALPLPILPTQILWLNIVEGGLLNFAFAFEPVEKGVMDRKPSVHSAKNVISRDLKKLLFSIGTVTGIFTFILFVVLYINNVPIEEIRTMMFVTLSLDSILFTFSLKSFSAPLWRINLFSNKFLVLASATSLLVVVASITFTPLKNLLQLTSLTLIESLLLVGVALFNIATIEYAKYFIFWRKTSKLIH